MQPHCNVCRMETIDVDGSQHRYCVKELKMMFDEDETHEFKGHLNFTQDQIPPGCQDTKFDRPSRQPITKLVKFDVILMMVVVVDDCNEIKRQSSVSSN